LKIVVFGAGAWGTALAVHAAKQHSVALWARSTEDCTTLQNERCNQKYLPGRSFPDSLQIISSMADAVAWSLNDENAVPASAPLWICGTSMAGLRDVAQALAALAALSSSTSAQRPSGFLWLCKGVEQGTNFLAHQVIEDVWPECPAFGALSGPSFADEVAAGLPAALTVATASEPLVQLTTAAFHHTQMRIYGSADLIGVELGGALKNVIAVATGVCDGLNLGLNARAALITRGLAEISRLGAAMGAQPETFMGLAGLGDLVLTCTGNLSRNRRVGLELASGQSLKEVLAKLGHVAEGVACANAAAGLAIRYGVEMPILNAVNAVIGGRLDARAAIAALVSRKPKAEAA
jgi:glycerol-3-phosphate dehydrogenase (NAD(P)+)